MAKANPAAKKAKVKKATPERSKAGNSKEAAADRREIFIAAYVQNGGNATAAAKTAGFSEKTARSQGGRLLTNVAIRDEIARRMKAVCQKFELSVERTLQEIARLAYSDPRKLYNADGSMKKVHELDDDTAATIASVEVDEIGAEGVVIGVTRKVKQWDKKGALDMAMKYHGLYEKDNDQTRPVVTMNMNFGGRGSDRD